MAILTGLVMSLATMNAGASDKPEVTIYATGGTIAGSSSSKVDTTDYKPGALGVEVLIEAVPALTSVATVSGEQVANVASYDVGESVLLKLAKSINAKLAEGDTAGVVITHGTDTTEETAFFLDLTVNSPKPVVLVGAMRPATALSADGPMNLLQAVALAASPAAANRGAMVVLNDRIASGYYVSKTNTTTIDTFKALEQGYLGVFIGTTPQFYYEAARPVGKPSFDVSGHEALPKVSILYAHQDFDIDLLNATANAGAKGIVIAGMGNGNVPTPLRARIKELESTGVPVVLSSRTGSGFVTKRTDAGIAAGFYSPQKARILLQLALADGADLERVRSYFEQ